MRELILKKLKILIWEGISVDVFCAERSYTIYKEIGKQSTRILKHRGYGDFFGIAQEALKDQFLLSISRFYDKPSTKNSTSCLEGILNFIERNKESLPAIREPFQLNIQLEHAGFSHVEIKSIFNSKPVGAAEVIINHYRNVVVNHRPVIDSLKKLRDKRLVHNERPSLIESLKGPTYTELLALIEHAKSFIGTIGWAYISSAFTVDGEYRLSEDARRPNFSLLKLLDDLDTLLI